MIRVLYVLPSLGVGGAERSLLALLRGIDRTRFEPHLCSLGSGGALRPEFEALGVPVHELGVAGGLGEFNGARLIALAVRLRPQIVHSRLLLANLWARLAGRLAGARVLCEERALELDRPRLAHFLNHATQRLANLHTANAAAIAKVMRTRDGVDPRRLRVAPAGIDAQPFLAPQSETPELEVISVHRFARTKGTVDLLEAFAAVRASRPGARLLLVGDGPERASLEARAQRPDLAGGVLFAGHRADLPVQLGRARVFALLSHDEGTPNAILEAMAAGLPVVATAIAGSAEAVLEGITGRLVPVRAPSAAAAALLRYLADPALAAAHGDAGRSRALASFSLDAVVRFYQELYLELLGAPVDQAPKS